MKILIVEDEPKVLEGLRAYFQVHGQDVFSSNTGQGAIDILEREQPQVTLLDLWLKDSINGLEVLRRARELSPKTAVIVITGLQEESTREEAMNAGAVAVLRKPIELDELDTLIAGLSTAA